MEVPLAMRACSEGGAAPGRGEAGGVASGEPSSGLLAGVAVGEKWCRAAAAAGAAQSESRRERSGEPAAEERREVSRELQAVPSTLLARLLTPLPHTLLVLLPAMLPSFGCSTVLSHAPLIILIIHIATMVLFTIK